MSEQPLEDLLARLERERLHADRLYNDALSALDRAIQRPPTLPHPPRLYDDQQIAPINHAWDILPDGPPPTNRSLKGRLRGFIWRLIGPSLEAQKRFNAALVDHINRNVGTDRETPQSMGALLEVARRQFEALAQFESLLVQYLQTVTLYVDTKDQSAGGKELRERIGLIEQRILALKREVEAAARPAVARFPRAGAIMPGDAGADPAPAAPQTASLDAGTFGGVLDSVTYVGFEDRFRGSQGDIRARVDDYMAILGSASDVLDVGCGRGELLELLRERGVRARGIDLNHAMVEMCRARGLDVEQADAVSYVERQSDSSLGGLVAIQVAEHFHPAYLLRFLETAFHKLRAGAPLVIETINPACWMAFFETYIRDLTHQRPLHPDTLRYLVQASGFTQVDVQYRAPVTEGDRLQRVPATSESSSSELTNLIATIDDHADKLNARLFSSMDYVVIARR